MGVKISVLGSINLDTTHHIKRIPLPGETLHVTKKTSAAGGKGANQAVAARRSGADVYFIGAVGDDEAGRYMLNELHKESINLDNVNSEESEGTGAATILLDEKGQNSILVYAGANGLIDQEQIDKAEKEIASSDYIIAQFETPQEATLEAFKIAKKYGVVTILNPAPASKIDDELLRVTDIIAPNETESEVITGIPVETKQQMEKTATYFKEKGVGTTLITLGSRGVYYANQNGNGVIPAHMVDAVDTTGAGDTFIGAMTSALKKDLSNLPQAIEYGQRASSITVQGAGAIPSIPTKAKVEEVYGKEL
jgi:ribokinase